MGNIGDQWLKACRGVLEHRDTVSYTNIVLRIWPSSGEWRWFIQATISYKQDGMVRSFYVEANVLTGLIEHIKGIEKEKTGGVATWDVEEFWSQGTCGAVALDSEGVVAVATSTGGMTNKLSGRIGDTPTLGAG